MVSNWGRKNRGLFGAICVSIVYNRLIDEVNHFGVEVLMRYTLRLLTSQQFQRAATLICALEYIKKRESLETLEAEQFSNSQELSIGLWVGQSLTPNTNKDAVSKKRNLKPGNNPFQILSCPWCKLSLENPLNQNAPTYDGYKVKGVRENQEVVLQCPDQSCHFGLISYQ